VEIQEDFDDDEAELNLDEWIEALPLVLEEVEQYRLDLVLRAIKLILATTSEDELPSDDEILDSLDQYGDAFFSRATSFLCCDLDGCHQKSYRAWRHYPYQIVPARNIFVGPLQALLEHQHKEHSDHRYWSAKERKDGARSHFDLPLEVSCAMSAVMELGGLSNDATEDALDKLNELATWEWENAHCPKKKYDSWRGLVRLFPPLPFPAFLLLCSRFKTT
jgi:hypothetical protein